MFGSAFGSKYALARTSARAVPLILCGLGLAVAWRAAIYNIGGEGQYIFGGISAAAIYLFAQKMPPILGIFVILIGSMAGGSLLAWFAGWLQVKRGVQVVISTILLNFIALKFLEMLVYGPLQESKKQIPQSERISDAFVLWHPDPGMDFHAGVFIAVLLAVALFCWFTYTKQGFNLRFVGESPTAARANKINVEKVQLQAMALSGALCGLAGGVTYLGLSRQIGLGFGQGWGFMGIPVALIGGLNPLGVFVSGTFFGALFAGSEGLARSTPIGNTVVYVVQAAAVLAFVGFKAFQNRKQKEVEE